MDSTDSPLVQCVAAFDLAAVDLEEESFGEAAEMVESAVEAVLDCTALEETESDALTNGINVLSQDVTVDGDLSVHPLRRRPLAHPLPTNPTAVDVYLEYYHREREFICNIYYRVHNPVSGTELEARAPEGPRKMYGFRPLLQMGRAASKRTFSISAPQVRALHRVLFGEATMMRLLFASVGIEFHVGASPKDDKVESESCEARWVGLEEGARWLGKNIRGVAEC
ncbi:hypothetical protein B0H13DRAFT_2119004 [Mycena leptocephala]|nr:hypothetical protein B0H13DRAFT_2119004 [Mycena leptocephala]